MQGDNCGRNRKEVQKRKYRAGRYRPKDKAARKRMLARCRTQTKAHARHHDERHKERDAQQQITDNIEKQIGREQQDCKETKHHWH